MSADSKPAERMVFINLSVKDLPTTMAFWSKLGFSFDSRFTSEQAACMVLSDKAMVMLLGEAFFSGFTDNKICDTATHSETLLALSCSSREEVDALTQAAFANGGRPAKDKQDHGYMYGWSFYDVDGHHWEPNFMDLSAVPWLQEGGSGSPG